MTTTDQSRISKRKFISRVATRSGVPVQRVNEVYEAILAEVTEAARAGEDVVLTGFGRFYRQDHKGHKVRFGKDDVSAYPVLKFSASWSVNRKLGSDEASVPPPPDLALAAVS